MTQIDSADQINKILDEAMKLRNKIKEAILSLPQNKAVKPLGNNCFSVSSSEVFKHSNFTSQFYNFQSQYQHIADVIDSVRIENVKEALVDFIKHPHPTNRRFDKNSKMSLHPDVITHLKGLIYGKHRSEKTVRRKH